LIVPCAGGGVATLLKDRQVVIVGGTGSIGLATAELLTCQGARVAMTGRDEEKLAAAAKRIAGLATSRCEVTDEARIRNTFARFGSIDHVIVLAGSAAGGGVLETPVARLRFVMEERIWGAVHVIQAAAPKMRHGSITLTSGLFADRPPQSGAALLAAALAGVEGLARALARELAPLRVNAVSFGPVRSTRHNGMGDEQEAYYRRVGGLLPVGRVGEAREAAQAILFALSNEYLTGEVIRLNGGAGIA
jgi:NAD(P)-dependent dehydrogenase (short-subunit alcohol dehydrogenase family)